MRFREHRIDEYGPLLLGSYYQRIRYYIGGEVLYGPWGYKSTPSFVSLPSTFGYPPAITAGECTDELHKGPPFKTGGPLKILKYETNQFQPTADRTLYGTYTHKWVGGFRPRYWPSTYLQQDSLLNWSEGLSSLATEGATGWNKFRPAKPSAGMGQFIAELRELPRMLKTTAFAFRNKWKELRGLRSSLSPKQLSDHWLNTQFGWFPFLKDLQKLYTTSKIVDKIVHNLRRDNGQWVRRRGSIVLDETVDPWYDASGPSHWGIYPLLTTNFHPEYTASGRVQLTLEHQRRAWFSAKFRYYVPAFNTGDSWTNSASLHRIFGAEITPALVWELIPWSWLVDWCSNAGDVIANATAILDDDLTAQYAYVMGTDRQKSIYTGTTDYNSGRITHSWEASMTRKLRVAASPFGFGLTGDDFTNRQWSILGALGISKLAH